MNISLLHKHLSANLADLNDDVLDEFILALQNIYADSIVGIVFYGSCMRMREYEDAVLDFYLVVDAYQHAYQRKLHALLNKLLPPNVFFLQIEVAGKQYQAKYAVVSQKDLSKRTSKRAFHPYFWARFAQPIATVFVRDQESVQWLLTIQQQSVLTLMQKVKCMLPEGHSSRELWVSALQLTYDAELRTESKSRAEFIYAKEAAYFDGITIALATDENLITTERQNKFTCMLRWKLRNWLGKFLSVLRLLKATITFNGGIDYIAWKIHRHTGEEIEVSDRLRNYPWLFCWPLLWRLIRSGKIR